ncbi:replication-associated recombination protein A [Candidatus Uhrbacteria bacterium]|nr:replication-associated recombination protein A [Candidatus Uhrbacteria bacterium]
MDLFDSQLKAKAFAPLADRMRPRTLEEFFGQEHLVGEGKVLRTLIEKDQLSSLIFWGPPGVGKTTLASIIASTTGTRFVAISAVNTGVKEAREIISKAFDELKFRGRRTILFIDEIHRFNKAQQDAFLPHVEKGTIILIGATTENPSFEVNSALLSRSRVFVLEPLTHEQLAGIIDHTLKDSERGLGSQRISIHQKAQDAIIDFSNGDARSLLNIVELAAALCHSERSEESQKFKKKRDPSHARDDKVITLDIVTEALQQKTLRYDKLGEEHYNVISAFIKSMRNSDANAALYWLARMIDAGESPLFIARRMVVFASEDIGLANPTALVVANAVAQAVDFIGMPEARINLAHGVVYLAEAKKSNRSYIGLERAMEDVKKYGNLPVPLHLRNAPTKLMKDLKYGKDYKYAHDYEGGATNMQCLPDELKSRKYID